MSDSSVGLVLSLPGSQKWALRAVFGAFEVVALAIAVSLPGWTVALGLAGSVGLGWWGEARVVRANVRANGSGLRIRNYFKTYQISWNDIDRLVGKGGLARAVRLKSGKKVRLSGLSPGWFGNQQPLETGTQQLQDYMTGVAAPAE